MDQGQLQRCRIVPLTITTVAPTQPTSNTAGGSEPHIIMSPVPPASPAALSKGFMLFIESGTAASAGTGYPLVIWKRDSTTRRWANLMSTTLPEDTWLTVCDCPPSELYFQITAEDAGTVLVHFEEI